MISPAGPSAKGKLDRFVQVTANANVGVVAGKSDVLVACAPRMSLTMPGPDIENGHWAAMHLVSLFMRDDGDNLLPRRSASCTYGLSSRLRHTIIVSSPPGASARRMFRSASPGK